MIRKGPSYISLFSGAGGLDLGLEMAGWRTAYASDIDPFAIETLRANIGVKLHGGRKALEEAHIEQADIRDIDASSVLSKANLRKGGVQLIAGGPPCQSWSSAGHQLGFKDPRGRLFHDFLRLSNDLDARWLLLENVRGLLTARGLDGQPGSALNLIRSNLLNAGYQSAVALLNAADHGVPQRRVRLMMICFRTGDAPPFPVSTHGKLAADGKLPWVSMSRALASVGNLRSDEIIFPKGKMAEDLAGIAPGSGVKSPGKSERTRPNGHWGYKQGAFVADTEQPARTVTASAQQDWIADPNRGLRRLSPRECAAIQSFPPEWRFVGPAVAQYRLIGNAVPPTLARAVGASIIGHITSVAVESGAKMMELLPLPEKLARHVRYTAREEASNGPSRRQAPARRTVFRSAAGA